MNESDRLLMHAALDGELDAPSQAAFETRLAQSPDLALAWSGEQALRKALQEMPAMRAPDSLRRQIAAMNAPAIAPAPRARLPGWASLAASVAMLGVGLAAGWTAAPRTGGVDQEILAGHLRGMISGHPVDVVSSDQHTVKPWFAGKLAVAPATPDLTAAGFPLEGGRIDVIAGEPAPTLVYRAGKHVVSVTRLPTAVGKHFSAIARHEVEGHTLESWSEKDATYVAISDASPAELDALAAAFRKANLATN